MTILIVTVNASTNKVGRCINGKDEACHMCVPDLSVLKSAVLGDKQYNLGAIVA